MRIIFLLSLLIFNFANAGMLVEKGMYVTTTFVIGTGKTIELAKADAVSAMPKTFEPAKNENSPVIECTGSDIWNKNDNCGQSHVRYILPVRVIK